jgi:hypothetical protein
MPLTRYEQETIISFNEAEDVGHVYTHNERWQRHLEALGFKPYRQNSFGGRDYEIPKQMIRLPRPKRQFSAEEKIRLVERGRALGQKRKRLPNKQGSSNENS